MVIPKRNRFLIIATCILILGVAGFLVFSNRTKVVDVEAELIEEKYANTTPIVDFTKLAGYTMQDRTKIFRVTANLGGNYSGKCTYVFKKGDKRLKADTQIFSGNMCSVSRQFSFFPEYGNWDITVFLETNDNKLAKGLLQGVNVNPDFQPKEIQFSEVSTQRTPDGKIAFRALLPEKLSGTCLLSASIGGSSGKSIPVPRSEKYVTDSSDCSIEIPTKDFKYEGSWNYTISFFDTYQQVHVKPADGKVSVY